jgi:GR25 family glycosyltransferase involved in LPS biosynthesis
MSAERYAIFQQRFARSGLRVERFHAINGKATQNDIKNKPTVLTPMAQNDIQIRASRSNHRALATWGAVGCYLSHVALWKKALESEHGIIVFEDDADLGDPESSATLVSDLDRMLAENYRLNGHFLYLTSTLIPASELVTDIDDSSLLQAVRGRTYGTWAYYISPEGARILLKSAMPMDQQVDSYIGSIIGLGDKEKLPLTHYEQFNAYIVTLPLFTAGIPADPADPAGKAHVTSIQTKDLVERNEVLTAATSGNRLQGVLVLLFYILSIAVVMRLFHYSSERRRHGGVRLPPTMIKEIKIYLVVLTVSVILLLVALEHQSAALFETQLKLNFD